MIPSASFLLKNSKTSAFLITDRTNFRYLTGLHTTAGVIVVTRNNFTVFVDERYREELSKALLKQREKDFNIEDIHNLSSFISRIKRISFEADHVSVTELSRWQRRLKNKKFIQTTGLIEEFRRKKSTSELHKLSQARTITLKLLTRARSFLRHGRMEKELSQHLHLWALSMGADGLSFDPIVAFGSNTSHPHHHPTSRRLKKRDIVQIDVGAKYKGYCGDLSEVYFIGRPKEEWISAYTAVKEAKHAAKKYIKPGVSNHRLDRVARDVLRSKGMEEYFIHALGHGVGLDIHEGVSISSKGDKKNLLKHEVITIEPGVYFPGKFGVRLEDMVVVD